MSQLLHKAEEHGQSRELKAGEVLAFTLLAAIKALALGVAAGALVIGGRAIMGEDVTATGVLLTIAGVFVVALAASVLGDLELLTEGLRSLRFIETFAPGPGLPQPKTEPSTPILIRAGDQREFLDRDKPLALPSPKRDRLELTPQTVSVILKEIVEGHDGLWSRARIMAIKVEGRRVPRRIYEELTDALARAGVLAERAQGGYEFPHHVETLDDLKPYFPGLPGLTGTAGRLVGGTERGGLQGDPAAGGEGATLADRRRARWEAERLRTERLANEGVSDARSV